MQLGFIVCQVEDYIVYNTYYTYIYIYIYIYIMYIYNIIYIYKSKYIETLKLSCRALAFTSYKAFQKNKKRFLHNFWTKIFLLLYSVTWPNFIVSLPLLRDILGNMSNVIVCKSNCEIINFEINLVFLIKSFFLDGQKVKTKI